MFLSSSFYNLQKINQLIVNSYQFYQKPSKMHQVLNTTPFTSSIFKRPRVSLGNSEPRYNSQVQGIRQKYYINSTRNSTSDEVPEWMGRTGSYYFRNQMRGRSLHMGNQSNFMSVKQTNVYEGRPKVENRSGPFEVVSRKRVRSHWEMKNHTFQLQWPKPEPTNIKKKISFHNQRTSWMNPQTPRSKTRDFTFYLPKYGIKQTPLHVQKSTPVKIGHKSTIDSIYVK